jgi:hypothetical protein
MSNLDNRPGVMATAEGHSAREERDLGIASSTARLLVVLALGLISTGITMFVVHRIAEHHFWVMGWYVGLVMPFGPFLIGLASSVGFLAGMWLTGHRNGTASVVAIAAALLGGYIGAHYVEFQRLNPPGTLDANGLPPTFWWFYDASTRAIYTSKGPLGVFGYALRLLEIGGLLFGGLFALLPQELATRGPASRFDEVRRLDERFVLRLLFCRGCRQGVLRVEKLAGPPDQKLGMTVESHPVDSMMVEQLLA